MVSNPARIGQGHRNKKDGLTSFFEKSTGGRRGSPEASFSGLRGAAFFVTIYNY
jgi:hypothetical protein